jgi:hypothetical protein
MPAEEIVLNAAEARVLGSLMEKEAMTPEYYPLSLNALKNACNQRSNREPLMDLSEDEVQQALNKLEELGLAGPARGSEGRVAKYEHRLGEAFNFSRAETALVCVLLLRGPQTPGELRQRAERIYSFGEIADVLAGLQKLAERTPSLAAALPRQPGTKELRYAQLLSGSGPVESLAAEPTRSRSAEPDERVERLEAELAELRAEVAALRERIDRLTA